MASTRGAHAAVTFGAEWREQKSRPSQNNASMHTAHPRRVGTNLQRRGAVCEHIQAILTRPTIEIHEHVDTEIVDGLGCSPSCVSPEMEETPSTRGVDLLLPRCRRTSEPLLVGVDAHSRCPR